MIVEQKNSNQEKAFPQDEPCVPAQNFSQTRCTSSAKTMAFLLLRFWLGARAIAAGLDKFSAPRRIIEENIETGEMSARIVREYSFENYVGVPANQFEMLSGNPIFPECALQAFSFALGPVLILLGVMILLGICTRSALFALGGLFILLTFGLSFIDVVGASVLGINVVIIAGTLVLSCHNRFSITKKF